MIPYFDTEATSVKLTKYVANASIPTRLSLINEIAGSSERVGEDIRDIVEALGLEPRIGAGYFAARNWIRRTLLDKDLQALITVARENSCDPLKIIGVLQRNELQ